MNKDNAKQFLPLVQALAEGKTIQRKTSDDGEWFDVIDPGFAYPFECYRIKSEPRRIWVNEWKDGEMFLHKTKESAEAMARGTCGKIERIAVEYVEVIK